MTEELQTVRDNLADLRKDHRVKMTSWDEPHKDDHSDEGCYFVYLLPGWSIERGDHNDHMFHAFSLPETWKRMKNVEPCLCDKCFKVAK